MSSASSELRPVLPLVMSRGSGAPFPMMTWILHTLVRVLALWSVVTQRFEVWIDLRLLGPLAPVVVAVWCVTVFVVAALVGPALLMPAAFRKQRRRLLTWWLGPSFFVLFCLIANCVAYGMLLRDGRADLMVPMPAIAAGLIGLWMLAVYRQFARSRGARRAGMPARAFGVCVAAVALLGAGEAGLLYCYARPLSADGRADIAVVLGGRINNDGTAAVELADRARVAINLYQHGRVKKILLSGAIYPPRVAGGHELSELAAMKQVCVDAGVPEEAMDIDPVGVNTRATAYNAAQYMKAHGYRSVVFCSTDFHLYRTMSSFADYGGKGFEAYAMASQPEAWRCADPKDAARECIAIVTYAFDPNYRTPRAVVMHVSFPRIVVQKSKGVLELFDGDVLKKTYTCITGGNAGDKAVEGDRKTPEGTFHIVFKNPESKFHLSLGLDYPNREDAERGLAAGLITRGQYEDILAALSSDLTRAENQKKLWYTPLGGEIFIHGHGEGRAGTAGCVALSNADVEELYAVVPVGTAVEIVP